MTVRHVLTVLVAVTVVCYGDNDRERCLRFGGGACCPVVTPFNSTIQKIIEAQPLYGVFFPNNSDSFSVDSICSTFFPAPDDSNTYIAYFSTVFKDGSVDIKSYMLSAVETGIPRLGRGTGFVHGVLYATRIVSLASSKRTNEHIKTIEGASHINSNTAGGLCQFIDTGFASLDCETDVSVVQRCLTYGACATASLVGSSGVFGLSNARRPISKACLNKAKSAISNNGLPVGDYIIPPMRLPTRCVLNQVCNIASHLQRFRETVGVAFPIINSYAYQY